MTIINYFNCIFFLFQLLYKNIKCQCNDCSSHPETCPQDCVKSIFGDKYIYCDGISSGSIFKYFYIYKYGQTDGRCHFIDKCPDKVVAKTKECVPDCKDLIEVGDFCFDTITNLESSYIGEIITSNKKKYRCKDYTYIQLIDGKEYHICIDDPQNPPSNDGKVNNICPSFHYDSDEKKCVDSCENKKIRIRTGTNSDGNSFTYQECINECKYSENESGEPNSDSEFEYDESINIAGSTNIYCMEQCPFQAPFFYKVSTNQSPKCQKNCNPNHFYKKDKNQCLLNCDGDNYYFLKEDSKDFYLCFYSSSETVCPPTHPILYEKACLKSCKDTQIINLFKKITYLYESSTSESDSDQKCIDDCYNYNNIKYFSDDDTLTCVSKCSEKNNKFHYNNKCINSCTEKGFKYYKKTNLDSSNSAERSELECVNECPKDYYNYLDICLKFCPKISDKPYANETSKECTSCKIPKDPKNPQIGEGYIFTPEDQNPEPETESQNTNQNSFCLKSCPSNYYYKINENKCIKLPSNDDDDIDDCYFAEDNKNICYNSCKEIPGGYLNEKDKICYKDFQCEESKYYNIEGYVKCITGGESDIINECGAHNYNYLRDNECVPECGNEKEYKILPTQTIYHGITKLGKCCKNPDCDPEYKYYSEPNKILNKTCSLKLIESADGENIGKSSKGTCVDSCPSDYPYESQDENGKITCKSNCENFYYFIENRKICVDDCKNVNKFYFEGEKECLNNCSKVIDNKLTYYYYDSTSNKCYISCSELESSNKYAIKADDSPQECLETCPETNKYYYPADNICLSSCTNGFIKSKDSSEDEDSYICVNQCDSDEVIINDNNCSKKCTDEEPFIASVPLKAGSSIMINKCVSNCKTFDPNYKYNFFHYESNKCYIECPPDAPYNLGDQCLQKCPSGYFVESNECKIQCDGNQKFYIKGEEEDNEEDIYKCLPNCDLKEYYVSSLGECVKKCGKRENFIGKNRRCKSICEEEDGIYYKQLNPETEDYPIYQCLQSYGESEYLVDGTKKIVSSCPKDKPYLSGNGNICYSICNKDKSLPFSTKDASGTSGKSICSFECKVETEKYYGEDKVCIGDCEIFQLNKIINGEDNSCVQKCNIESLYRFETNKDGKLHCLKKCEETNVQKYSEKDYKCVSKCLAPDNYVNGNICSDKCPEDMFAEKNEDNEYICKNKCESGDYLYYYKNDRECIKREQCIYVIQDTKECTSDCSTISDNSINYYYYDYNDDILSGKTNTYDYNTCVNKCPEEKPFLKENNHCAKECNKETYPYYKDDDKICLEKCPSTMYKNGYICEIDCPKEKFLDTKKNECIDSCENDSNDRFYNSGNNICLPKCEENKYKNGYECVEACPSDKKYSNLNKECVDHCDGETNYVIDEFTHNEEDIQKICMSSCTQFSNFYKYYIEEKEDASSDYKIKKCVGICSYYILPESKNTESIECFRENCPEGYDYFIKYENNTIQCLKNCPNDMPYYYGLPDQKKQCYKKCPENTYFKFNSFECSTTCDTKIIDYESNECLFNCPLSKYWANDEEGNIYCLDKCNINLGEYLSINRECVKSCNAEENLVSDISDPKNKQCKCQNLFYINDSGNTVCLHQEIEQCSELLSSSNEEEKKYLYRIFNTNQCTKYCFGYLSPSEDICYLNVNDCEEIDINTVLILDANKVKCDCKYRYYYDKNTNKKICLGENEDCSIQPYLMYIPENKECVDECKDPYLKSFNNICFKDCPEGMGDDANEANKCKCDKNWYISEENKYYCLNNECNGIYKYEIEDTKECVTKCLGTKYEVYYNGKCYLSCSSISDVTEMTQIEVTDEKLKEIADYTCQCKTFWFYDDSNQIECTNSCQDPKNYIIKETNECRENCPVSYFSFNKECFKNCEDGKKYGYSIKSPNSNSKECICENLWKKNDDIIECIKNIICDKLMIYETKQCIDEDECPDDLFKFNNQCYKKCPEGTKKNILDDKSCLCENLWYQQENGNHYCLKGKECPKTHPYKIFSSNECVSTPCSELDNNKLNFNNTCYENCPDGTIKVSETECICDPQFGYWFYIEDAERPKIIICDQNKCPNDKNKYKEKTNECIANCGEEGLYEFDNVCYEGGCPPPTLSENEETNKFVCIVGKYKEAENLDESHKYVKEQIVELYKSVPEGGISYKADSSTMQIYGINKQGPKSKELNLRSSLSYIDIGSCSEKVYLNNKMEESDDIVVVKYDLENQQKKSLVNPVEYEFINSRTGQVLDMSVCKKDDVVVSYSLFDILNFKKNNINERVLDEEEENEELNNIISEIQNKFQKGKEIYKKYQIDSFNINSKIYNEMCFPFEIEGKDLTLEDRVKYLFPYYSLCEANCSYSSTDFEIERVYCNCPLKKEFDSNREQKFVVNDNNIEEIKSKQNGPTNIPIMKCISKLSDYDGVKKNGGFFYSLIILIFEIGLFFLTIFYNYKLLKNKINKNNLYNKEEKEINLDTNKRGIKEKNNDVIFKTSERNLNAPPKKREIIVNEIDINDIKLEKKFPKNEINNKVDDGTETEDPRLNIDENNSGIFGKEYPLGILNEIKKEEKFLRIKFENAKQKDKSDIFIILLTEICDKIYLFKTLCLLRKYDMFTIYSSLYLLYHLLLLTMITCFYDIKTIQTIWSDENYPGLNFDLGYGLLACLIVWIIYRIFLCLLNNNDIIKKYLKKQVFKSNNSENDIMKENDKDFENLLFKIKLGMIIYFAIELIVVLICLLYLTSFCGIYIGTKSKVFKTYGIALVEVLIIKIIYGLLLGIIRKVGLYKQNKSIYKISYYFDNLIY